jgi:UDP:flavonoid glycosyltransferase YjiC (YdhE family)
VYGADKERSVGNVSLRRFSAGDFLDDLRTAKAVIGGGGFSLMSEAVSLRVPMLAIPIEGQYEQELNARYLEKLGYGSWERKLGLHPIRSFLDRVPEFEESLKAYEPRDNAMLFACLDELIERVKKKKKRPTRLDTRAMGPYPEKSAS